MNVFEEYVPEWGWLCVAAAEGGYPLISSRADERRYKTVLYKKAEIEMAKITDYTCKNGTVVTVIKGTDMIGARRVVNAANASFAKSLTSYPKDLAKVSINEPHPLEQASFNKIS